MELLKKIKDFFQKKPEAQLKVAFCETEGASSFARWHIRTIPDGKLRPGGGINTSSLCGKVNSGWDIECEFSKRYFPHCCPTCVFIWSNFYE